MLGNIAASGCVWNRLHTMYSILWSFKAELVSNRRQSFFLLLQIAAHKSIWRTTIGWPQRERERLSSKWFQPENRRLSGNGNPLKVVVLLRFTSRLFNLVLIFSFINFLLHHCQPPCYYLNFKVCLNFSFSSDADSGDFGGESAR